MIFYTVAYSAFPGRDEILFAAELEVAFEDFKFAVIGYMPEMTIVAFLAERADRVVHCFGTLFPEKPVKDTAAGDVFKKIIV